MTTTMVVARVDNLSFLATAMTGLELGAVATYFATLRKRRKDEEKTKIF